MPAIWPTVVLYGVGIAAASGALLAGLFVVRRSRRIRRGCCPACAAPVGTTAKCARCGAALPESLALYWEANRRRRLTTPRENAKECRHVSVVSLSTPRSREALAEADLVLAVDLKTGRESIVYGRDYLRALRHGNIGGGGAIVRVEVHPELDDLEKLCTAVGELRGHHEYRPPRS
ncbi:MAG: hypothetical protein SYC29_15275 [Planctomycetota bacterium]|nr:hypothetical protein [Planctomycetota bacterium]